MINAVFLRPSGNDTALVLDPVPAGEQPAFSNNLMEAYPNIEQVMFVSLEKGLYAGRMAGGEFCANAARALGFYATGGNDGNIRLNVSGASEPLSCTVQGGFSAIDFDLSGELQARVRPNDDGSCLVDLDGITHVVVPERAVSEISQTAAMALICQYELDRLPACGVIFLHGPETAEQEIVPYVYVRATGSFVAETACGSGTLAAAMAQARKGDTNTRRSYTQPSRMKLDVGLKMQNGSIRCNLDGPVEWLAVRGAI